MTRHERKTWRWLLFFVCAVCSSPAQAAGAQVLHAHVPAAVAGLQPVGHLPGQTRLKLAIGLPLRNREALTSLLQQIYDPASPNYRHYLTPEQFTEMFGPTEADYRALIAFSKAEGLTVSRMHPNRVVLDVDGAVTDIEKAFHVTMRVFQHPTEARTFYAPDVEPSLDLALPVLHISGLDNYRLPHPMLHQVSLDRVKNATPSSGSGSGGSYMGNDFRAAYAPRVALTGFGQTLGLLEFDGYYANDITTYEANNGLPNVPLKNVLLDGFSGIPTTGRNSGNSEVALDIEMAISMAPGLSKVIVYEAGPNGIPDDILSQMASDNQAKQLSCSWSLLGAIDAIADQLFQQMAAQGQSFFDASGDTDAFVGDTSSQFPSDDPYITQVGGTTLTTTGPGGSFVSETVWNAGNVPRSGYLGSSGGISTIYSIPSWQQGISMSANQGSTTMRNLPDVAMVSDNISIIADNGQQETILGTSCAAPLWAGFIALVNQQAVANGQPTVGFINPAIYAIGKSTNYTSDFHDITTGNNEWPGSPTRFSAVAGYDLCTGWGTPTGSNLINALVGAVITNLSIISTPVVTNALLQAGDLAVVVAGETNVFAVDAVDPDGDPLSYHWSFGDGTISDGLTTNTADHAYTGNCGPYTTSVTVSDGQSTTSANLTVAVACDLTITGLQVKVNFTKANADSCTLKAILDLGAGFSLINKSVTLNVSGAQAQFTLDAKGKGRGFGANGSCKLNYNKKTGLWTFTANMKNGSWQDVWASQGLRNASILSPGVPVQLTAIVLIDNEAFAADKSSNYTAKANKLGTAR